MTEIFIQDKHLGLVEMVQRELEGEIRISRKCKASISVIPAIHKNSYLSVDFFIFSEIINLFPST